jgi:hypothetical protein
VKINKFRTSINNLCNNNRNTNKEAKKKFNEKVNKRDIIQDTRDLQHSNSNSKDFGVIRDRINSGFYNSDNVISKVAEAIMREFAKEN